MSDSQEYFYEMLQKIRQRPGLFLGKSSITRLRSFLDGYMLARADLGMSKTQQEQKFDRFQCWVQSQFNINSSQCWDSIILFYSADEKEALNYFFDLFDKFKNDELSLSADNDKPQIELNPNIVSV